MEKHLYGPPRRSSRRPEPPACAGRQAGYPMSLMKPARRSLIALLAALSFVTACRFTVGNGQPPPRTITVAQSGEADVIGSDNVALQRAADMLRPGDTLEIGPGTYKMENSLLLPSGVTVRGTPGKTILLKSDGVESLLYDDAGYGLRQVTAVDPSGFRDGMGITVLDDEQPRGWGVTVTTITRIEGNILFIDPMTIWDYLEQNHARIQNTFPILAVINAEDTIVEDIIVDGNKDHNGYLDGCRGGAIYLQNVRNVTVKNCVARNYNGDGISFQITEGVRILNCESYGNTGLGIHPGTGSERPEVRDSRAHDNGQDGLYLCWRVRHGVFAGNIFEDNGRHGISIGHKDTDNLFENNRIVRNGRAGVYFRPETFKNSGHRNTVRNNTILDNGNERAGAGIYIAPHATGIVIEKNRIAETRTEGRTQRYGIYKVTGAGEVRRADNIFEGNWEGDYREGPPLEW